MASDEVHKLLCFFIKKQDRRTALGIALCHRISVADTLTALERFRGGVDNNKAKQTGYGNPQSQQEEQLRKMYRDKLRGRR